MIYPDVTSAENRPDIFVKKGVGLIAWERLILDTDGNIVYCQWRSITGGGPNKSARSHKRLIVELNRTAMWLLVLSDLGKRIKNSCGRVV